MTDWLMKASEVLEREVRPHAQVIDTDEGVLRHGLAALIDANLLCLRRPEEFGGPEVRESDFREFQELVASESGALAFLQTQHQSAVSLIAKSASSEYRDECLKAMHRWEGLTGIGFSQLRRPGIPVLRATETTDGYLIDGNLPWATGYGFFPWILVAAEFEDRRSIFFRIPFAPQENVRWSAPMRLAAMDSARTVSAEINGLAVPREQVLDHKPANWIHRNDMINITLQGFFALGNTRASLRLIRAVAEKRDNAVLREVLSSLEAELHSVRQGLVKAMNLDGDQTTDTKLNLRGWAIDLMGRAAHAAITVTSGAANSVEHPAQRVYREALVFTVSAQTTAIMESTLRRLVRDPIDPLETS